MAYESIHQNSPFRQRVAEVLPEVLKPLRYCEFRSSEFGERSITVCAVFACAVLEEMPFCYQHAKLIHAELLSEVSSDVG